jgi:hypothetical protein
MQYPVKVYTKIFKFGARYCLYTQNVIGKFGKTTVTPHQNFQAYQIHWVISFGKVLRMPIRIESLL